MRLTRRDVIRWTGGLVAAPAALLAAQKIASAEYVSAVVDRKSDSYQDSRTAFLQALAPSEGDLQGFLRQGFRQMQPAGSVGAWYLDQFAAKPLPDIIRLDVNLAKQPMNGLKEGRVSSLERSFVSLDTFWQLQVQIHTCDSIPTAQKYLTRVALFTQAAWRKGTLLNSAAIGDESWVVDETPLDSNALWFRLGAIVARVDGSPTVNGEAYGFSLKMPPSVVEALAHLILLRSARENFQSLRSRTYTPFQPSGVDFSVLVRVNDELLPRHSCQQVGDQVYVPVLPFVDAASQDLQARWDGSVGALMLLDAPYQALTLALGSHIVKEGGPTKTTLKVPLFREGDQPYLALKDLLSLLPRSKVQAEGEGFSVQVSAT